MDKELVFEDDYLTWNDVNLAAEVEEPSTTTRSTSKPIQKGLKSQS